MVSTGRPIGKRLYDIVQGCCDFVPGSEDGKRFWLKVQVGDLTGIMPEFKGEMYSKRNSYIYGDYVVDRTEDNRLWKCMSWMYCRYDPTSILGSRGWKVSAYTREGIPGWYDGSKLPLTRWFDLSKKWNSNVPFIRDDVVRATGSDYFVCAIAPKCREFSPMK